MPHKDKQARLEWQRKYTKKNRERINLWMKGWRERNKEKARELSRINYHKHKEKYLQSKKKEINKHKINGLCTICNNKSKLGNTLCEYHLKYHREFNDKHKDKYKEKKKEYYYKNKEKIKMIHKKYYQENKDRIKIKTKQYQKENKDRISERCKKYRDKNKNKICNYHKDYYQKNKPKIRIKRKERLRIDKKFNISSRLSSLLNNVFHMYIKNRKIMSSKKYGIDYKAIIEHLKPFPEDLSKYHIDHIKPLCSFNFINSDGSTNLEEIKKAFAPENHQWLTAEENLRKIKEDRKVSIYKKHI